MDNGQDNPETAESGAGKVLALVVVVLIFGGICTILRSRTWRSRILICIFVGSLVSTQLLMKRLGTPPVGYRFSGLITALHFFTVWSVCLAYWCWVGDAPRLLPLSIGSYRRYLTLIVPIAISLPLSVVFNNTALSYIGAGLNGIVGTLAPMTTALLSHFCGRRIPARGWMGMGIAGVGATILGLAEWADSKGGGGGSVAVGFAFSLSSVLLRSSKVVLQDQLLAPGAYAKDELPSPSVASLSVMHVWALQAPPCCAVALSYAVCVEDIGKAWSLLTIEVRWLILATCASATVLNLLGMYAIKELGASSMQIVGKLNTIILCAFSVAFLGERLPPEVLVGAAIIIFGIAHFEHALDLARRRLILPVVKSPQPVDAMPTPPGTSPSVRSFPCEAD